MSSAELILRFSDTNQVNVAFEGHDSAPQPFVNPVSDKDRSDIRWYIETYGAHSLADPDDKDAARIEARLPEIGKALFKQVFASDEARDLYKDFRDADAAQRILTVETRDAAILSLPWELLHDTRTNETYLFRYRPHISIRRRMSGDAKALYKVEPRDRLHLLFVISRPRDAGFIDPRTDPQAVLDAIDRHAPGRISVEFLRPATLNALHERLNDDNKPRIDILHFDGHGVFQQVSEKEAAQNPGLFGKSIQSVIQRERRQRKVEGAEARVGVGFLVFENEQGEKQLIAADDLANELKESRIGLVVLSACQSATLNAEGDPMAGVAGGLTTTGIPAILAMTHSVLVKTTEALFGNFYQSLARGRGIVQALDDARAWLANNPDKFPVRRGDAWHMLQLQDWFLPALFHVGRDAPLLTTEPEQIAVAPTTLHNLRKRHETGFFGRRQELWRIERWFAGATRRISITGFGGQGKTELALEAGRWLLRCGLFQRALFVDYAHAQTDDALGLAVSTLGSVLEQTLSNEQEIEHALATAPTLIILDNLETLADDALHPLLDAASHWSELPGVRLLLTSRRPEFNHAGYPIEGTREHRHIALQGLGSVDYPDDAIDWCAKLHALPIADESHRRPLPKREELVALFDRVAFHPLSIAVLAQQLHRHSFKRLSERLDLLLNEQARSPVAAEGTPPELIASLQLSLERLNAEQRRAVARLGVFQGGAFEDDLLAITELGQWSNNDQERRQLQSLLNALEAGDPRPLLKMMGVNLPEGVEPPAELLQQLPQGEQLQGLIQQLRDQLARLPQAESDTPDPWPELRRELRAAALIEVESVPGVAPPFLRFHPTLAPMLWAELNPEEQASLRRAYRQRYQQLAGFLYNSDRKNPDQARAIARRELPNLLQAVEQALAAGDEDAVDFVDSVNRFLNFFGRHREAVGLTRRAEQLVGLPGSDSWFLYHANLGEQLLAAGQATEALAVFTRIHDTLQESSGGAPSYRLAVTLSRLGRCHENAGHPDRAEAEYRRGIEVTEELEQDDQVRRHRGALHTDLADVLRDQGRFSEAHEQYTHGLEIMEALGDKRSEGAILSQLGTLAMLQGDLEEAVQRNQQALELFRRLGEPVSEAVTLHQLGRAFQEARQWDQAEHHYRESALLKEQRGDLAGAARTWNQLAIVCKNAGRPEAAETWYRKAIEVGKATGDRLTTTRAISNLADLLQSQPGRLDEARQLAEQALAIEQTLHPGAAQIWNTYNILAVIADRQQRPEAAADYRRQAREARAQSLPP
ncbi:MAG: tetratricopeptide repeat protein [Chromatiales bacterium]|nr:tetratricopeptide repeat protein [Chromatiales bacterium]